MGRKTIGTYEQCRSQPVTESVEGLTRIPKLASCRICIMVYRDYQSQSVTESVKGHSDYSEVNHLLNQ